MSELEVVMYATSWCPYCARARRLLTHKRIAFREVDVEAQSEAREEMARRSGRRSVPQIFIGETHVGGCDDLHALEASGELERLVARGPDATEAAGAADAAGAAGAADGSSAPGAPGT
jgi:glutaredoxin 3